MRRSTVVSLLAVGAVCLLRFLRVERSAREPLLPLEFFRRRNFTASLAAQTLAQFAYMGGFIISPLLRIIAWSSISSSRIPPCPDKMPGPCWPS